MAMNTTHHVSLPDHMTSRHVTKTHCRQCRARGITHGQSTAVCLVGHMAEHMTRHCKAYMAKHMAQPIAQTQHKYISLQ